MMKKILIIDGDLTITQGLSADIMAHGHAVVCCETAQEAFEQLKHTSFDLIIMSVELPDQNGFVMCSKLRKDQATARIPLFLISSSTSPLAFEQHSKLPTHADSYFLKPVDTEVLLDSMNQVFEALDAYQAEHDDSNVASANAHVENTSKNEEMIDVTHASDVTASEDDSEVLKAIDIDNIDLFGDIDANDVDDVGEIFEDDEPFVIQEDFDASDAPSSEAPQPESAVKSDLSPTVKSDANVKPIDPVQRKEPVAARPVPPPPSASAVRPPSPPPIVGGVPKPNAVPPIAGISRPVPPMAAPLPPVSPITRASGVPSPAANAEITRLNADIEALKAEVASLKETHATMQAELQSAQAATDAANTELCTVKAECQRIQTEVQQAKAEIEQKDSFIQELQNTNAALVSPDQYNDLVNQYNEFQTHYNDLVDQFNELSVRCNTAETQLAEITSSKSDESSQLQMLLEQRTETQTQIKEIISKLSALIVE